VTIRETFYVKGISRKEKRGMALIANDEMQTTRYDV
jgi:hypothetical protein